MPFECNLQRYTEGKYVLSVTVGKWAVSVTHPEAAEAAETEVEVQTEGTFDATITRKTYVVSGTVISNVTKVGLCTLESS